MVTSAVVAAVDSVTSASVAVEVDSVVGRGDVTVSVTGVVTVDSEGVVTSTVVAAVDSVAMDVDAE